MSNAHPGFKAVAQSIASKSGLPAERARAILASRTREASKKAVQKNPRLKRVPGGQYSYNR
jgi:hypothetical protein